MFPRKKFWKLDSWKRHILDSLDRTQLNRMCIVLCLVILSHTLITTYLLTLFHAHHFAISTRK